MLHVPVYVSHRVRRVLGRWLIFTSSPRGDQSGVSHILHPPPFLRRDDDVPAVSLSRRPDPQWLPANYRDLMVSPDDSMLVDNGQRWIERLLLFDRMISRIRQMRRMEAKVRPTFTYLRNRRRAVSISIYSRIMMHRVRWDKMIFLLP